MSFIQDGCLKEDWKRGIVAIGICLGWVELIFLTGRLKWLGGEFRDR